MESKAWSAESREALAAVAESVAALAAVAGTGVDHADQPDADPLRGAESGPLWVDPLEDRADACLDGMGEVARMEAGLAALKVRLTADYVESTRAMAPPVLSLNDRTALELAMVAEVACVLTVSERAPGR